MLTSGQARLGIVGVLLGATTVLAGEKRCQAACARGTHCGVDIEAVDSAYTCKPPVLKNSVASGQSFLNELYLSNPFGFQTFWQFSNPQVYDTDFMDPLAPSKPPGQDSTYFDEPGMAISFFQGHGNGVVNKPTPDQLCTSQAQCVLPTSGESVGTSGMGACVLTPQSTQQYGPGVGVCQYKDQRQILTCGLGDQNKGFVPLNGGDVVWGENATNGNWDGVGTTGGTSMVFIKHSNGMMAWFPTEWFQVFGGLHLYAGAMVSWGDSCDSAAYGPAVAASYFANPYASIETGYVNAINSIANDSCSGCGGGNSNSGGFNGCGCHVIMTMGTENSNHDLLNNTFKENWGSLNYDLPTQTSQSNWYWNAGCNYDAIAYPWMGGG